MENIKKQVILISSPDGGLIAVCSGIMCFGVSRRASGLVVLKKKGEGIMNTLQIKYFLTAARCLNFTEAAK